MKTALLTANYNDILCQNVRESFQHAADRWGAEYVEATRENHPVKLHPATAKLEAFDICDADAVFIIDADAIIRSDCPNPFEVLPKGHFSVVGLSPRVDPGGDILSCGNDYEWGLMLALPGVEYMPADGWNYFNSGVMLAYREQHKAAMDLAYSICRIPNALGWIDQTPINYACKRLGVDVHWADERWNFIHGGTLGKDWMTMHAYQPGAWIYHFAGECGREHVLPLIAWK